MPKVFIKKTINFEFLGNAYKDCEASFSPIPIPEYKDFIDSKKLSENESIDTLLTLLKNHFLSGKFIDDQNKLFDMTKENITEFDLDSIIKMFNLIVGRVVDPKDGTS